MVKWLFLWMLILGSVGMSLGSAELVTGLGLEEVQSVQGYDTFKAWDMVKHLDPKIKLNTNILSRIDIVRNGGKIPPAKFKAALKKQLGDILNSADEVNANKILDRLNEAHINEKHFDNLVQRLDNPNYLNTLVKDLKQNPEWFEFFLDLWYS